MNIRKKKALRLKAAAARKQAEVPVVEEKAPVVEKVVKPKPKPKTKRVKKTTKTTKE